MHSIVLLWQKWFISKNIIMLYHKHRLLCWFGIRWADMGSKQNVLKYVLDKIHWKKSKIRKTKNSHSFFPIFFLDICYWPMQLIWNQHNIFGAKLAHFANFIPPFDVPLQEFVSLCRPTFPLGSTVNKLRSINLLLSSMLVYRTWKCSFWRGNKSYYHNNKFMLNFYFLWCIHKIRISKKFGEKYWYGIII